MIDSMEKGEADAPDNLSDEGDEDVDDHEGGDDDEEEDGSSNPHAEQESLDEEDINNMEKGKKNNKTLTKRSR